MTIVDMQMERYKKNVKLPAHYFQFTKILSHKVVRVHQAITILIGDTYCNNAKNVTRYG